MGSNKISNNYGGTIDRKISNSKAATLLGISRRQVIRIKNKVRRFDFKGIVHGNRGRSKEANR